MKKTLFLLSVLILSIGLFGQTTNKDVIVNKAAPLIHANGTGAVIKWYNTTVTESGGKLTSSGLMVAPNWIQGYTSTVSAGTTLTLTSTSTHLQFITGSTTHIIVLPVVSTLALGHQFYIINNSTGLVTVNSSGGNLLTVMASGTRLRCSCVLITGTDASSWSFYYQAINAASGKKLTINNTLAITGTDATTMTFPTTNATIARTDAAQTFTGTQTFGTVIAGTLSSTQLTLSTDTCKGGGRVKAVGAIGMVRVTAACVMQGLSGGVSGQLLTILNTTATTLTLTHNGTGTQKIMVQGAADLSLTVQYQAVILQFDGTNWYVVGKNF
jgi:hypothetical protein